MQHPRPHLLIIDALNLIRRLHAVQAQQALTPAQALIATRANLINTCKKLLAVSIHQDGVDGISSAGMG